MLTSTVATHHNNTAHGEDNYLLRPLGDEVFLGAIMDGVTGHGGREASQKAVDALAAAPITSPDDVRAVLEDINETFYAIGRGQMLLTTVSVALFLDGILHVLGVGNSAVLFVRRGAIQYLSGHPHGLMHIGLARALGTHKKLASLYRAEVAIEPGDRVILTTDGITDNVTNGELVQIMQYATSPYDVIKQLTALLTMRQQTGLLPEALGGRFRHDDQTAIVRFFNP